MKVEMRFTVEGAQRRQLLISADSVNEFSEATWFRQFIGLDAAKVAEPKQVEDTDLLHVENDSLRRQLDSMKTEVARIRNMMQQQPTRPAQPVQQAPPQNAVPPNFLDVTPDAMTNSLWDSLSPDQQAQYSNKYLKPR